MAIAMKVRSVKDVAAERAQDAASHGYNGRTGKGAELLQVCAHAVRIASRSVEREYHVPALSADERAEYAAELAARLIGENDGRLPGSELKRSYLVKRAQGLILNDRARRGVDMTQPSDREATADARLDGPLSVPDHVAAACDRLQLTETGRRALIAAVVPATRREWADFYGYGSPESFKTVAKRGRAELRSIGQDAIRRAIRDAEREAADIMDEIERDLGAFLEAIPNGS